MESGCIPGSGRRWAGSGGKKQNFLFNQIFTTKVGIRDA